MTRVAVVVAVWCACACGYPEVEMQAQRNQIDTLRGAVVEMATAQAVTEGKLAELTERNARLTEQLSRCEVKP